MLLYGTTTTRKGQKKTVVCVTVVCWRRRRSGCSRGEQSCRSWRTSWEGERRCSCAGRPVCNRKANWRTKCFVPVRLACIDAHVWRFYSDFGSLKQEAKSFLTMTFQALSQDLLRVSVQLESLEEKLQNSSRVSRTGRVTVEELQEERNKLKKRRDTLDAQLRDNRVLTVEVRKIWFFSISWWILLFIIVQLFFFLLTVLCVCLDPGGAFPAPAGGSYRSSGCCPGV